MGRETLQLSVEEAGQLKFKDAYDDSGNLTHKVVLREHYDERRWYQVYWVVFEHQEKFWGWTYSLGSTEHQEDEYLHEDNCVAYRVFPKTKTVTVYD